MLGDYPIEVVLLEVAQLRSRGVEILEFDLPGRKTMDGIADVGHAFAAWFMDPGKELALNPSV